MKLFNSNDQYEQLKKLLKNSSGDFQFDENSVKFRLLASIHKMDQKPIRHFRFGRVMKYSAIFATLVVVLSGTLAFASNALPGDKLFTLNKAGENMILSLPLSVEQKAKVQEYIVNQRFEALDKVKEAKKLDVVKESDESLNRAIDDIAARKKSAESKGNKKSAEKLEKVLDNLQSAAEKREQAIKKLQEEALDDKIRLEYKNHLIRIQTSRQKARTEIRRFNSTNTSEDRSKTPDE